MVLYGVKDLDPINILSFLCRAERTSKQRLQTLSGLDVGSERGNLCFEQLSHTTAKHLWHLYYRQKKYYSEHDIHMNTPVFCRKRTSSCIVHIIHKLHIICICVCVHENMYVCVRMSVCILFTWEYVCVCANVRVCVFKYIIMSLCECVCISYRDKSVYY